MMEKPELLSVISVAADRKPRTIKTNGTLRLHPDSEERVYNKIKAIFEIAKDNGNSVMTFM